MCVPLKEHKHSHQFNLSGYYKNRDKITILLFFVLTSSL